MLTGRTRNGVKLSKLEGVKRRSAKTTWVLVAHQFGATILRQKMGEPTQILGSVRRGKKEAFKPASSVKKSVRPYNSHTSAHEGQIGNPRRVLVPESTPRELLAEAFAGTVADVLQVGRVGKNYNRLILISEPRFMGKLNSAIDLKTRKLITQTLEKDLAHFNGNNLVKKVEALCTTS